MAWVFNALVDSRSIEKLALARDMEEGKRIMFGRYEAEAESVQVMRPAMRGGGACWDPT